MSSCQDSIFRPHSIYVWRCGGALRCSGAPLLTYLHVYSHTWACWVLHFRFDHRVTRLPPPPHEGCGIVHIVASDAHGASCDCKHLHAVLTQIHIYGQDVTRWTGDVSRDISSFRDDSRTWHVFHVSRTFRVFHAAGRVCRTLRREVLRYFTHVSQGWYRSPFARQRTSRERGGRNGNGAMTLLVMVTRT